MKKTSVDIFEINPLKLGDLPSDLVSELVISEGDALDSQIMQLLSCAERSLNLNDLIVGSFRKHGTKHKRHLLTARLYRLVNRGLVCSTGKGKYSLAIINKCED